MHHQVSAWSGRACRARNADDGESGSESAFVREPVKRGHQLALSQISVCAVERSGSCREVSCDIRATLTCRHMQHRWWGRMASCAGLSVPLLFSQTTGDLAGLYLRDLIRLDTSNP